MASGCSSRFSQTISTNINITNILNNIVLSSILNNTLSNILNSHSSITPSCME